MNPDEVSCIRAVGHLPGHPLEDGQLVDVWKGMPYALVIDKSRGERLLVDKDTGESKVFTAFIPAK